MVTEEQKFIFDLKGYLLIPEVLKSAEIKSLKEQIETIRTDPESLPVHERRFPGGVASMLIDYPAVMDILNEIAASIRSALIYNSGKLTLASDLPDELPVAMFNEANIKDGSFQLSGIKESEIITAVDVVILNLQITIDEKQYELILQKTMTE